MHGKHLPIPKDGCQFPRELTVQLIRRSARHKIKVCSDVFMEHLNQPPVSWTDIPSDGSLKSFAERNQLDPTRLVVGKGLLVLPRNTELPTKTTDIDVFPTTSKELLAYFTDHGLEAGLYGQGNVRRELVRKSADVLLPLLIFAGHVTATVGLSLLSSWIYDRFVRKDQPLPSIKVEYAELEADGRVARWRRAEGPADQVCRLLQQQSEAVPSSSKRLGSDGDCEDDWWQGHCQSQAHTAEALARELVSEGKRHLSEGNHELAERLHRRALVKLREAVLWEPNRVEHRTNLHALGKDIHDRFGCELDYHDGCYWVNCPVLLSHSRGGFSVRGTGRTICSVCDEELLNCPHVKGRTYDGITARKIHGELCNICGQRQCGHIPGNTYDGVRAFGVVVEMELEHVSFVENPANPLAVVQGYSFTRSDMVSALPEDERDSFEYGETTVHCHHCKECDGS